MVRVSTGTAYYEGGPKDGQLLLASDEPDKLMYFPGAAGQPGARYRMTDRTVTKNRKTYRVFEYVSEPQRKRERDRQGEE